MSDPKIAVTNLPAPGAQRSSPGPTDPIITRNPAPLPPRPSVPTLQQTAPEKSGRGLDLVFKVGFLVAAVVAGFFIFRTVSLHPQLVQAKANNSQLELQLAQMKAESDKAQANARELSDAVTQLQTQQKQFQIAAADAKAQTEKAAVEVGKLQAQLKLAHNEAAVARANAQKSAAEVARLQARLQPQSTPAAVTQTAPVTPTPAAAPVAPVAPPAPVHAAPVVRAKPMPVNVSFRKAEFGDGNALLIQNTSDSALTVDVTFSNPTSNASKVYHLVLDGGATKQLGSLGAWILSSGDRIQIESAGCDPIAKTAP